MFKFEREMENLQSLPEFGDTTLKVADQPAIRLFFSAGKDEREGENRLSLFQPPLSHFQADLNPPISRCCLKNLTTRRSHNVFHRRLRNVLGYIKTRVQRNFVSLLIYALIKNSVN